MKTLFLRSSVAVIALGALLSTHFAAAASGAPDTAIPGSTFSFAVTGFTSAGNGAFLVGPLTGTFGGTQTFAGAGLGNQTVTLSSSESTSAGFTTTTITISVPMNFDPVGTMINGMVVTSIFFELGGFNAGANPLDFNNALTGATFSGSVLFSGGTLALTPTVQLSNGDMALAESEGVNSGNSDIAPFAVRSFSFSSRYAAAAVPDAGDAALLLALGAGALLLCQYRLARRQA